MLSLAKFNSKAWCRKMLTRLSALRFCTCMILLTIARAAVQFWVSTSGSDSNAGDEGNPFASLHRAQDAIRAALNASTLSEDATVTVLPGVYIQPTPLVFGASDSGNGGWRVVWNCTGASLYVGVAVTGWAPDPARPGVWMTNVTGQFIPPTPIPAPTPPGCGVVEPDWSYNGYDITTVLVQSPNNVSACCEACAAQPGCLYWSLCVNITCGTPVDPVNCYLVSVHVRTIVLLLKILLVVPSFVSTQTQAHTCRRCRRHPTQAARTLGLCAQAARCRAPLPQPRGASSPSWKAGRQVSSLAFPTLAQAT